MPSGGMIVQTQVRVSATPQAVFDALVDPATWSALDPSLVHVSPRELVVLGTTGTMRRRVGPAMAVTTSWEVTEFTPGACLEMVITGFGYGLRETIALAADPIGTRVSVADTLTPTSLVGRVMVALSGGILERDLRRRYAKLEEQFASIAAVKPAR